MVCQLLSDVDIQHTFSGNASRTPRADLCDKARECWRDNIAGFGVRARYPYHHSSMSILLGMR